MLEYRTETCAPNELDKLCELMQTWGWKLEQTQEVYNENVEVLGNDTRLVGKEDIFGNYHDVHWESTPITQKKVTHYISARFSRDKSMPNYLLICQLENEFYNPKEKSPAVIINEPTSGVHTVLAVLFTVLFIGAWAIIPAFISHDSVFIAASCIPVAIISFICIIFMITAHKKYKAKMQNTQERKRKTKEKSLNTMSA